MSPYFSIILPIYNVENYLEKCIQSILNQSFTDYELILVDDGATDRSPEICDDYASRYEHIQVIHKPNGGLSSARNAGTDIASGRYIWWVDSDDWIAPEALQLLYNASAQLSPDMIKFNHIRVEKKEAEIYSCISPGIYCGREEIDPILRQAFLSAGKFGLSAWTNVYSIDFLRRNNLNFVSERITSSEDYLFNLKVLLAAECVCVLKDPLYFYRQRLGSLSDGYKKGMSERYAELYRQLREHYLKAGMLERYEDKICGFYAWHLIHGTCMPNEYTISNSHSVHAGRKNVSFILKSSELQYAVRRCDYSDFSFKQQLQLKAMKYYFEPLFYWLFFVKPRFKKGISNEN